MIRGTTLFICDKCNKLFKAPDIEYNATVFSVPQHFPKCGSIHTMPLGVGSFLGKLNPKRAIYRKIWEELSIGAHADNNP